MFADKYLTEIQGLIEKIRITQGEQLKKAAGLMADSIQKKRAVYMFGSGHSVLPCQDLFPRYGSFVGFVPIMDPRLMWFSVVGPGGARELLWLERTEGYIKEVLRSYNITADDTMLLFSHGGTNAAAIEVGLQAREIGAKVVSVTSMANYKITPAKHSSGKKLADVADVVIDNCCPPEDAIIPVPGQVEPVSASSTVAFVATSMSLLAETAELLAKRGVKLSTFVSPNVADLPKTHNQDVFVDYTEYVKKL